MRAKTDSAGSPASGYSPREGASAVPVKEHLRRAVSCGLYYSGMLRALKSVEATHQFTFLSKSHFPSLLRSSKSKFGILCYHRVGTAGVPYHSRLSAALFEAHMRYARRRYRVVPLGQLVREVLGTEEVPPTLAVTFDDGYRDLYTEAFPILRRYQIPATIYLIGRCMETGEAPWYDRIFAGVVSHPRVLLELEMDRLLRFPLPTLESRRAAAWKIVCYLKSVPDDARQRWCKEFDAQVRPPAELLENRMLDWKQVREMQSGGMFFGAHTMNHPAVSRLDPVSFQSELVSARELLEAGLGTAIEDFAYPFGKSSDGSLAAHEFLVRSGYRSAATTIEGFNRIGDSPFMLRRLQIDGDCSISLFAFRLSRLFLEAPSSDSFVWSSEIPVLSPTARESEPSFS